MPEPPGALRSVLLCPGLPTMVRGGNDLRNRALVAALAHLGPTGAIGLRHDVDPTVPRGLGATWWRSLSVPALSAEAMNAAGTAWLAESDGHPSDAWWSPEADAALSDLLDEIRPDVVVLSEALMQRYAETARRHGARVVLDLPSLHSMTAEIASAELDPRTRLLRRLLAERSCRLEEAALTGTDEVWVCSPVDQAALVERGVGAPVHLVPNVVEVPVMVAPLPDVPLLVFPGSFSFPPNHHAALRLITSILPGVRAEVPGVRLALIGGGATADLATAATSDGVELVGPVPDTRPWFDAAAVVPVPLTEGGGTRMKILEALAHGRPVVTTPKGYEGLDLRPGIELLEGSTDAELVTGIVAVLRSRERAASLGSAGREAVRARYSLPVLADLVRTLFAHR